MVKADMLYQLNLQLNEIKQNDRDFGGVAVILSGDLMQLRPVQARYIFQKPKDNKFALSFLVHSLWKQFDIVELQQNHRQGKDGVYADILNRIRFANHTKNDMELLRPRVSQSLPVEAIHLFGTNAEVNNFNEQQLDEMEGKLIELPAINIHPTIESYKPHVSKDGRVHESPLLSIVKLKKNPRIMITYNVEIYDGIVNGSLGTVRGFVHQGPKFSVQAVLIEFDDPETGKNTCQSFDHENNLTPVERITFEYKVGKKNVQNSTNVKVIQFSLKLAWTATVHKFHGQTITKPMCLVGHMEQINQAAQAYVLLGRIQSIDQLYLSSLESSKIKINTEASAEAFRLCSVALNAKRPLWYETSHLKICHLRRLPTVQPIFGHLGNTSALINMSYFFQLDMKR